MTRVRHRLTVHPETVRKAETVAKVAQESRKRRRQPKPADPPVTRRYKKRPDWCSPLAWKAALRLAGGDVRRLEIESAKSILVKNR